MLKFTVSTLSKYIENILTNDIILSNISIEGEISEINQTSHGYFFITLKDESSSINCIMFDENAAYEIYVGQKVLIKGEISLFKKSNTISLKINKISSIGSGDLYKKFLDYKNNIYANELDKIKSLKLKRISTRIGLITSPTGAAIKDFLKTIELKFPKIIIDFFPVSVQGQNAIDDILLAMDYFDNSDIKYDAIVITRGGGSYEDLSVFNNEKLIERILKSKNLILSAIGHERDEVILDIVSDVRASTPTDAANKLFPNIKDVIKELDYYSKSLNNHIENKIFFLKANLNLLSKSFDSFKDSIKNINLYKSINNLDSELKEILNKILSKNLDLLNSYSVKFNFFILERIKYEYTKLIKLNNQFEKYNSLELNKNGYALLKDNNDCIINKSNLKIGDYLFIEFYGKKYKIKIVGDDDV